MMLMFRSSTVAPAVLEQNLDKGKKHGIVRLHELAHGPILAPRRVCGNVALRPAAAISL